MTLTLPRRFARPLALTLAALSLLVFHPGARAQTPPCPPPTVVIQMVRPGASAMNMGGVLRVDIVNTPAPPGYVWYGEWVDVYDSNNVLRERGLATRINGTTCYYNCITTVDANGGYTMKVEGTLLFVANALPCDVPATTPMPVGMTNPTSDRHTAKAELDCACRRDCVCTQSSTSPRTGAQAFTVPVTSWDSQGATYGLGLTYQSHTLVDPQAPAEANFAGLSEVNDH